MLMLTTLWEWEEENYTITQHTKSLIITFIHKQNAVVLTELPGSAHTIGVSVCREVEKLVFVKSHSQIQYRSHYHRTTTTDIPLEIMWIKIGFVEIQFLFYDILHDNQPDRECPQLKHVFIYTMDLKFNRTKLNRLHAMRIIFQCHLFLFKHFVYFSHFYHEMCVRLDDDENKAKWH